MTATKYDYACPACCAVVQSDATTALAQRVYPVCTLCGVKGRISEELALRRFVGAAMAHDRIERGILHPDVEAMRLGVGVIELARFEAGFEPTTEEGRRAFAQRISELIQGSMMRRNVDSIERQSVILTNLYARKISEGESK